MSVTYKEYIQYLVEYTYNITKNEMRVEITEYRF